MCRQNAWDPCRAGRDWLAVSKRLKHSTESARTLFHNWVSHGCWASDSSIVLRDARDFVEKRQRNNMGVIPI